MKTYLDLPHMLPVTVKSVDDLDQVWIVQPGSEDADFDDQVLLHREQVPAVIQALQAFLAEPQP